MKVRKFVTGTASSLGLVVGFAALAGATPVSSINHTGPHSHNSIKDRVSSYVKVENENEISVSNHNYQSAWTGDATVSHNTTGGGAYTGDATNTNSFHANVSVENSVPTQTWMPAGHEGGGGSISYTGPDSHNTVDNSVNSVVKVENENEISINNSNYQKASTGDATVSHNTTGGDAVTGDATNTNSTSVTLNVSNN